MSGELKLRIISGIILAAVVLLITWAGGASFNLLAVAIGLLIFHEWMAMSRARAGASGGESGLLSTPVLAGWAVMIAVGILTMLALYWVGLVFAVIACFGCVLLSRSVATPYWFAGSVIYAAGSMVALAALRNSGGAGAFAIVYLFAVVWTTDIMAYFVGRTLKGPKLAPAISPGKTWSGAAGGTLFALVAAFVLCLAWGGRPSLAIAALTIFLSVCSQAGDLFESALKRRCGVKDSSHLIPGHGGVMDRVDGLVAAAFAMYVVMLLVGMTGSAFAPGDILMDWAGLLHASNGA